MKKMIIAMMAVVITLSAAACGKNEINVPTLSANEVENIEVENVIAENTETENVEEDKPFMEIDGIAYTCEECFDRFGNDATFDMIRNEWCEHHHKGAISMHAIDVAYEDGNLVVIYVLIITNPDGCSYTNSYKVLKAM